VLCELVGSGREGVMSKGVVVMRMGNLGGKVACVVTYEHLTPPRLDHSPQNSL